MPMVADEGPTPFFYIRLCAVSFEFQGKEGEDLTAVVKSIRVRARVRPKGG
jgi:hypothetical protein